MCEVYAIYMNELSNCLTIAGDGSVVVNRERIAALLAAKAQKSLTRQDSGQMLGDMIAKLNVRRWIV
jgi:hypothetical protein